jgi:hypothetical protein
MKRVIFTGFFGMTTNHAQKYINMWNKLGYSVDFEPYTISDVLLGEPRYNKIQNNFVPKNKHYDVAYCISGGSLHMKNLISAKNNFTIKKIIFDSGPYLFSTKHIEHYIHQMYFKTYKPPLNGILTHFYKFNNSNIDKYNKEYYNTLLNPIPKLILTCKNDKIIVNDFINDLKKSNNVQYHEFEQGKHGNIYKYNESYIDHIDNFMK